MSNCLLILCVVVLFVACIQKEILPDTYEKRFYRNEKMLKELVQQLKEDSFLDNKYGQTFKPSDFNNAVSLKLRQLEIADVHLFSWGRKQRQFEFKTNWRTQNNIHFWYNSLDSIETVKGYHKKDENSNEIWGLGNNWALISEIKFSEIVR